MSFGRLSDHAGEEEADRSEADHLLHVLELVRYVYRSVNPASEVGNISWTQVLLSNLLRARERLLEISVQRDTADAVAAMLMVLK